MNQPLRLSETYPLTAAQRDIWLDQMTRGDSPLYTIGGYLEIKGTLDPERFQRAVDLLIKKHDALRTVLHSDAGAEGVPRQTLADVLAHPVALHDFSDRPDPQASAQAWMQQRMEIVLPLDGGPLFRFYLLKLDEASFYFVAHVHHIILDGWGISVMFDSLGELYSALESDRLPDLSAPSYVAFIDDDARYRDSPRFVRDQRYWLEKYQDVPEPLFVPRYRDRYPNRMAPSRHAAWRYDHGLNERVDALAQAHQSSRFAVLLAALYVYFVRTNQREELVIGLPILNRSNATFKKTLGLFTQVSAVRLQFSADLSFGELVRGVARTLKQDYRNQRFPLSDMNRSLGLLRDDRAQLFDVSFSYEPDDHRFMFGEAPAHSVKCSNNHEQTPLAIHVRSNPHDDSAWLHCIYNEAYFQTGEIEVMADRFQHVLEQGLNDDGLPIQGFILPTPAEALRFQAWNATDAQYEHDCTVHGLFEAQAAAQPDAVAVVYEDRTLTYGVLNARANQVAHRLLALGICPDDRVAICVERGLDMIVGLLGILKSGAGYVPLDPAYPRERLAFMLDDSAPVALLTQSQLQVQLPALQVPVLLLDQPEAAGIAAQPQHNPDVRALASHHLAYVIYTSGSTGLPKGVMVEHRNVARLFSATQPWFDFNPQDVWALFHSFAFDFSVWEIWGALTHGGRLLVVPQLVSRSPQDCYALLCEAGVTVLNQTPSAFRQLIAAQGESDLSHNLRQVIFGGEALETGMLKPWYAREANAQTQLVNMYGITETTVHVTYRALEAADAQLVGVSPIGKRIPDLRLYLLDQQGQPVPMGVEGELYVGGAGVARGYLNRPQLNQARFMADPFDGTPHARMYRTGDLGRWLENGELEYLGRNDEQVKIRGFRIELGEIEAKLTACESVREAVVIAREDEPGDKRLVAYVIAEEGAQLSAADLRAQLLGSLAEYMVPSAFVILTTFPLTTNGKLDRKALPAPDSEAYARRTYEAPAGAVEITLAGLWAELLGVEQVGRHDRFFELGGHSLLAVKLIERMRQVGLSADVRVLFGQPTLATLAAAAGASSGIVVPANGIAHNAECITPDMLPLATLTQEQIDHVVTAVPGGVGNVQDIYGLVPLQEGILYHHLATGDGDPYLLQATLRVDSRAQLDAFVQALQAVIERHDILRTSVAWEGLDEPVQVVWREARLGVEELTLDQADGDIAGQLQARFDPRHIRFDLRQAPLMRIHFAEDVRGGSWVAVLLFHHLIDDATSLGLLGKEIEAHLEGRSAQLPVSVPYRNYVAQVRLGVNREQHEAFFSDMLGDVDEPTLPFGLQDVQGDGSGIEEASLPLCAELGQRLRAQARRLGVSTASLHHLAWGQVVGRVSGRTDVVFGTVLMGRLHSGQDAGHALGMFVNTLPLRVEAGGQGVLAAVKATHARLAALLGHEHAPLSLAQRCSGVAAPTPLFSALMNYRQAAVAAQAPKDAGTARVWAGVEILGGEERTNYPLSLSVDDLGESFGLTVQAVAGIGAQRVCAYMHTVLEALADALDHDANAPLHSLAILPDPERRQLLEDFNAFDAAYPSGLLIHQLFEAHADARPEAVAVTYEDQSLSYGELNRLANQVAHRLLALGIRADDRVAICVDRGLDMVAGLIGILKAGAGYVPLDPAYPAERLAYMLEDSAPKVLLTQRRLQQCFPQLTVPLLLLDAEDRHAAGISDQPQTNPDAYANGLNPESLAYVIYTSGSTGQPKGVAMAHRPLVNLMQWQIAQSVLQGREAARTLQFAALGFDVAFQEVFSTLCAGGELSLIHADTRLNLRSLFQHICTQRIERLYLPCIALQALAETVVSDMEAGPLACGLRDVITAGEQLRITPQIRAFFERLDGCRLHNHYGPTESHVTTALTLPDDVASWPTLPAIGQPVANTRIYLLDEHLQPVPVGVAGEIHIGGACVARGYLNRADLTAERFIHDPFAAHGQARLYKTGDLGRYQPDGCIEYLGRNDDQIKIRGFRVELGEIEARLCQHAGVKEATVLAREDSPGDKRLVAYFTAQVMDATPEADSLRAHLQALLPDYMIPAAYVPLEKLPLSPNGKLDRRALPAPEADAFASREYQAPLGDAETTLARLWAEVLGVERVGRHDHFFELGGHSLLAVKLIERMRQAGLSADVRVLFGQPTLAALAAAVGGNTEVVVPANGIPDGCERITPAMLTLMTLSQAAIDRIVATAPGGVRNVQDIYPLAPLQEGILYHHISATQGDPYLLQASFVMDSRAQLDGFVQALQVVIDRHDILRTAVLWEGLDAPLQVVLRKARLVLEEVEPDPDHGDVAGQLGKQFDPVHCRLDLGCAPLMRLACAWDGINQRWVATLLFHHIALDHTALDVMQDEMLAYLRGESERLSAAMPYRNYVAQALLGVSREQHESFFRDMLGDVDEPTLPFGLREVQGDGSGIEEVKLNLDAALCLRLRRQARQLGVSAASLHHLAWARVLGRLSGREDVVFGTVLLGRMQSGEGADRALGMFINTLPLRVDVGACSVRSGVKQTHGRLTALLAHEHAPLTLAQRCSGVAVALPLFSALLNYRHSPSTNENGADLWAGIEVTGVRERTNYPCTLSVDDQGEGFLLSVQTFASIGAQRIADYMYTTLQSLVDALEHAPDTPLHSLEILPGAERRQLLVAFNLTDVDYPRHPTIHQRFETQAARHPDTVAVVYGAQRLTYGELNRQANQLAHRLLALGVRPEDRVAICMRRSLETVVGLVAILKSGACYVPMDPSYPTERLAYMLKDSSPVALLTQQVLQERLPTLNVPVLLLDADRPRMTECAEDNPMVAALTPESLAYIIYTSGSTGEPKGVMVEHRNLDNLVSWHCQTFELEHGSRTSSVAGFGFDAAAWEVWPALCAGATLLLPPAHAGSEDVDALLDWWQAQALDVSFLPTPIAEYAFGRHLAHDQLRTLLIGGDRLRKLPVDQPFTLINNYGPTETTIVATSGRVDASEAVLHIGKPVANTRVYLLDTQLQPVPVGVTGELYIGGAGVARGYLNRSTLTAERFVRDPFSPVQNARMYRSGDLGRYLPDGNIEYLGRNDGQLKIRGFRIELGEIESRLGACTGVREAVVIAVEDALGDKRLVAYYTAHDSEDQALTADSLRAQLQVRLPEYMVPAAFMHLDALPLTPNGKLDRRALPVPDSTAYSSRGYEAPQGEMETVMADIWRSLLGVERIGRHDDFFELGGHSLLAVRLTSQVRQQLGVELGLAELFANPELSTLAALVMQAAASTLPPIVAVPRNEVLPLSFAQQRLWFLAQMEGGSAAYHIAGGLRLKGRLEPEALHWALERIVARHEALRTTFNNVDGEAVQCIATEGVGFALAVHDLAHHADVEGELARLAGDEAHAPFDLEQGPLIRGRLVRLADDEHVLLVTMHHIVSDGWSMSVLTRELGTLYHARLQDEADPLPPLSIQYVDYAVWQRRWLDGDVLSEQKAYWQEALAYVPPLLMLPTDRARPAQQDYCGATLDVEFDQALTADLKALSQRHGTTLYMTVLAGWAAVLGRLSGQETIVIGSPVANRTRVEVEGLIGFFVNTLALPIDVSGEPSIETLLQRVKTQTLSAQAHQDLPFEQVVEAVKPVRSLAHSPLFQAMLSWHNTDGQSLVLDGLTLETMGSPGRTAKFDVSLNLGEANGVISGGLEYATALFDHTTMQRYLGYLERMLRAMVADARVVVSEIALLGDAEHQQLHSFNATETKYPRERTIHSLFETRVERTPDALAIVQAEQCLSYRELNTRANRLARHLMGLGVQPGDRVAIVLPRSIDLVVSQLAILKCAAVYVPLDINAPLERQHFMVQDSQATVVLTHSTEVVAQGARRVDLDVVGLDAETADDLSLIQNAESVAYVMYTSGSTGTPKGVLVPHRAISRLVINNGYAEFNAQDRVAFASNPAFDASTLDVWAPLLNGGCVVVVEQDVLLSQERFRALLLEQSISVLWMTAGLFHQYASGLMTVFGQLRCLIVGGDVLDPAVISRVLQEGAPAHLLNGYGPTEATTFTTTHEIKAVGEGSIPIGRPIGNTRVYVLDAYLQPVPMGVAGELYIGGDGVANGYLNRPELTAEKFITDPFSADPQALLYRTGDLARWLADGTLDYLGRNDDQVKVRGFRIELGEIEAKLAACNNVREAVVIVREDEPGDKRLVAYVIAREGMHLSAADLRTQLSGLLAEYMVPGAFMTLPSFPLTANGKLDRRALPAPDAEAYASREYAAPQGEVEQVLAQLWAEVLKVERVGRHDHFFELGGHSLLAVKLIECMRQAGLSADVRVLFSQPTLAALAAAVGSGREVNVPANLIPSSCERITPDMLPLASLTQEAIDRLVATVPGGARNVQDIYPLAPLQEGILYHHLAAEQGDPYVLQTLFNLQGRERLDAFVQALQSVIERHDILRTSVVWQGLDTPMQVVWREAKLHLEAVDLDPAAGDVAAQLQQRFDPRHYRLDITRAPLMRLAFAEDAVNQRWVAVLLFHHMALDHTAMEVVQHDMQAHLLGEAARLTEAVPYRNYVAQARLGLSADEHEAFFRGMLGDIDEPTLPFGLQDVQGDGRDIEEARQSIEPALDSRLRAQARQLGVSAASLVHLAWAQVLGKVCGKQDVVFGTVLMGRMQGGEGADRALGMFINTLPLRVDVGAQGVRAGVKATHARLTALLGHEHASLALAQRCSGVAAPTPLFSSLLNYRHSAVAAASVNTSAAWRGIEALSGEERTNYPLTLNVDDLGNGFNLSVLVTSQVGAQRVCAYMYTALEHLVEALESSQQASLHSLSILPAAEREQVLVTFNATEADYPQEQTIHGLFEAQVRRTPDAAAVLRGEQCLSYRELNERANRLAHYLRGQGVQPDARVAICVERGVDMVVGLLAILKAGGGYVPLDPAYPADRIAYMLADSAPAAILAQTATRSLLTETSVPVIDLDSNVWQDESVSNPEIVELTSSHLAYLIYTSGSTGLPKGVMIEHRNTVNFLTWAHRSFDSETLAKALFSTSLNFDLAVYECFAPLTCGGRIEVVSNVLELQQGEHDISLINTVPSALKALLESGGLNDGVHTVNVAGEALKRSLVENLFQQTNVKRLCNLYGPSETTTYSSWVSMAREDGFAAHIGKPVANTQFYLLDEHGQPVPLGVPGEIYIGGAGVARGYLNRDDLTAERFLRDPFSRVPHARMYRTGDLGRYLPDGNIEYLGRNDDQVKIRGFRIELGEIEAKLAQHQTVKETVVLAREDIPGEKRLVAYFTPHSADETPDIDTLRAHLQTQLPDYMVPAAYVRLDALPLTPNGKLDRKALPAPDFNALITRGYEAPIGEVEITLAQLWAEVLNVDRVGRHDHFFELGGHSLLAVSLMERLRQAGLEADVRTLFEQPTLSGYAATTERMEIML